jgi:hypothetical protein
VEEKIKKNKPKDFLIAVLISSWPTVFIVTILMMVGFGGVSSIIIESFIFLGLFFSTLRVKEKIKNEFSSSQYLHLVKRGKLGLMLSLIFIIIPLSIFNSWADSWTGFPFSFFLSVLIYGFLISLPLFLITFFITVWVMRLHKKKVIDVKTKTRMSKLGLSPNKDWQKYYEIREEEENMQKLKSAETGKPITLTGYAIIDSHGQDTGKRFIRKEVAEEYLKEGNKLRRKDL